MLDKLNRLWQQNYAAITFAAFFIGIGIYAFGSGLMPTLLEAQTFYAALVALSAALVSAYTITFTARHKEDREDRRIEQAKTEQYKKAAAILALFVRNTGRHITKQVNWALKTDVNDEVPILGSGESGFDKFKPATFVDRQSDIYSLIMDLPAEGAGYFYDLENDINEINQAIAALYHALDWENSMLTYKSKNKKQSETEKAITIDETIVAFQETKNEYRERIIKSYKKLIFLVNYLDKVRKNETAASLTLSDHKNDINSAEEFSQKLITQPQTVYNEIPF